MSSAEPQYKTLTEQLGAELYALMQGSDGASVDAIRRMPCLMSLGCVRTGVPHLSPHEKYVEAIAANVRTVLTDTTCDLVKPLEERELVDETDRAAAARCFLGLERGTESLDTKDRRIEAALYTGKDLRTMAKTQNRPYRRSHEHALMVALAEKLLDREIQFLNDSQVDPSEPSNSPLLAGVSDLYGVARDLYSSIESCLRATPRPADGEEYAHGFDVESLCLLGRFSQLVNIPPEEDRLDGWADPVLRALLLLSPTHTVAAMFSLAPFERDTIDLMGQVDFPVSCIALFDFVDDLMPHWHAWLRLCVCDRAEPRADCPVHRFQTLLDSYIELLDDCWRELRDPYHSPSSYKIRPTPDRIIREYSLNPAIDK